jgi:serine/threonine protein kinase
MAIPSWIGQVLNGRYHIKSLIGQGGMSAVYRATDTHLQRTVALKLIHAHLSVNPDFVRRFQTEATAVAQLRHPHIVQIFDFNHEADNYYIIFEYIAGQSLQERLQQAAQDNSPPFSTGQAITIARQIAAALAYAHQQGIVHRDVKPANILLTASGEAILTDFGIAKLAQATQHTVTGAVLGTAQYMAPEQVQGQAVDGRTDIYALGITLFEMLSGRPPYMADSVMSLMMMHVSEPVPDIDQLKADLPPGITAVLQKALAKQPDERFATAADFEQALAQVEAGKTATNPTRSEPDNPTPEQKQPVPVPTPTAARRPTKPPPPRPKPQKAQPTLPPSGPSVPSSGRRPPPSPLVAKKAAEPVRPVAEPSAFSQWLRANWRYVGITAVLLLIAGLIIAAFYNNNQQAIAQREGTVTAVAADASTRAAALVTREAEIAVELAEAATLAVIEQETAVAAAQLTQTPPTPTLTPSPRVTRLPTVVGERFDLVSGQIIPLVENEDVFAEDTPFYLRIEPTTTGRATADIYGEAGTHLRLTRVSADRLLLFLFSGSDIFVRTAGFTNGATVTIPEAAALLEFTVSGSCMSLNHTDEEEGQLVVNCFAGDCSYSVAGETAVAIPEGSQLLFDINELTALSAIDIPVADTIAYQEALAAAGLPAFSCLPADMVGTPTSTPTPGRAINTPTPTPTNTPFQQPQPATFTPTPVRPTHTPTLEGYPPVTNTSTPTPVQVTPDTPTPLPTNTPTPWSTNTPPAPWPTNTPTLRPPPPPPGG